MLHRLLPAALALTILACDGTTAPTPPPPPPLPPPNSAELDGSWRAIYWLAEPTDAPLLDVIELGGTLDLEITAGYVVGAMYVPPGVTGGSPASADMAGVVLVEGGHAKFAQLEDSFVRRATWTIGDDALYIVDHEVETTRFTVVLVRGW